MLDKNNFKSTTISSELSRDEIKELVQKSKRFNTQLELIVQGNQEIMVSKEEHDNLITHKQADIDKLVLEKLVKCIKNNIIITLDENDIIRIANMYYNIFHQYNLKFLGQVMKYSNNDLDVYKILDRL